MTKISLYTVTLILMGFLSLSSSARPIGNNARGADNKNRSDVDGGEGSGKWTGDWKSTSSSDDDYDTWNNRRDSSTPPNVTAAGASNSCSDEFASAIPAAKLHFPSGPCSLSGSNPRSSSPTHSAASSDFSTFSPPSPIPTLSYGVNDATSSQADQGHKYLPSSSIPGALGSPNYDPSGYRDGAKSTESSGLSSGSPAPHATQAKQGADSIATPSEASIATKSANRVVASLKHGSSGKATWYNPGLGSCGETDSDSDLVVALATSSMAGGKSCNKSIKITDSKTGKSASAKVRDTCPSCAAGDLDMSPALFKKFESLDVGKFDAKWNFE